MTQTFALDSSTRVDTGRVRANNEDAVGAFEPADATVRAQRGCLWVVADGMGGHAAGEVASNYAVQEILHLYYSLPWNGPEHTLAEAIRRANDDIHEEGLRDQSRQGMGSTMVAAAVLGDQAIVAHVGDCRAYIVRGGALLPLTADHSWVAERLADGTITPEEAETHPNRGIVTRNLGSRLDTVPDVARHTLLRGDRLLLCSDGLWSVVSEQEMAGLASRGEAGGAVEALVAAANNAGSPDNIGVALVSVGGGGAGTRPLAVLPGAASWNRASATRKYTPLAALGRGNRTAVALLGALLAAMFALSALWLVGALGGGNEANANRSTSKAAGQAATSTVAPVTPVPTDETTASSSTPGEAAASTTVYYITKSGDFPNSIFTKCGKSLSESERFNKRVNELNAELSTKGWDKLGVDVMLILPGEFLNSNCPDGVSAQPLSPVGAVPPAQSPSPLPVATAVATSRPNTTTATPPPVQPTRTVPPVVPTPTRSPATQPQPTAQPTAPQPTDPPAMVPQPTPAPAAQPTAPPATAVPTPRPTPTMQPVVPTRGTNPGGSQPVRSAPP